MVAHRRQRGRRLVHLPRRTRHRPAAAVPVFRVPLVGCGYGDGPDEIHADDTLALVGAALRLFDRETLRSQAAFHRAALAQVSGECAGVDALNADDVIGCEVLGQRGLRAPGARQFAQLLDYKPADLRTGALAVLVVDTVVADERVRHGHDLAVVRRVGEHLLVARHGGVETNLAHARRAHGAKGFADKRTAIFEHEQSTHRAEIMKDEL